MAELHLPRTPDPRADNNAGDVASHHEASDVNIGPIVGFGTGLILVGVVIHLLIVLLFRYFDARETARQTIEYPLAITEGTRLPPEPRLQTNPRQDLRDLRAQEDEILDTYGWVDRNAGVVRIPIDEAMRLTVQRGLPARDPTSRAAGAK
jgi:hypothetical protein